eukprot:TRINITY_DN5941_c0_g1_i1.p1 TRINITY_DN5941_c0_g1~~TRINITY_DN5941_c0_g1_i1.p1  ORF type:complete len:111 (-),score=9.32 TRINITY_DN5941_c0_g1_i1:4-336(-)
MLRSLVGSEMCIRDRASSMCDLLERQLSTPGQPLEGEEGRALSVYPLQCIDALQKVDTASVGDRRVPCLRTRPPYKYRPTDPVSYTHLTYPTKRIPETWCGSQMVKQVKE